MTEQVKIVATEFSFLLDSWRYLLSDGSIVIGDPGNARIPVGLPFNDRMQWGTNWLWRDLAAQTK
jgi:hypothetical protein